MDRNYDVKTFQITFILRRPWVAIFTYIIKILNMFIKKKLKQLKVIYYIFSYRLYILDISEFSDFRWKNADISRIEGVRHMIPKFLR